MYFRKNQKGSWFFGIGRLPITGFISKISLSRIICRFPIADLSAKYHCHKWYYNHPRLWSLTYLLIYRKDKLTPFFSWQWKFTFCDWTEFEANRGKHMENFSQFTSYRINIIIFTLNHSQRTLLLYLSVFTLRNCTVNCDHVRTENKGFFISHTLVPLV